MGGNSVWSWLFTSTSGTVVGIAPIFLLLVVAVITLIVTRYGRRIYIAIVTLPRDLR
jgi:drug/metabolite transporter superfamily protein YnfA